MRDPEAVRMAAFTAENPDDRHAFDPHGQGEKLSWGRGIASQALELLLTLVPARPLHARAASDNIASLRVLQKAGFHIIGTENSYAPARDHDIEETILRLE